MSAFHLSIYRSKIFSTAFPALETFISSFIESSISIPLPLSTLIPKGRSSIKIIDLFSSKMKWKIFSEESCNLEAKLSQKLVRKYRCNLRFSESPPISMSHASTEFGGRIKSEGWEARSEVENRVNLGPTRVHDARDAETRDGHFAIPRSVPRPLFASRFNYSTKVGALSFPAAVARCERKNNPS